VNWFPFHLGKPLLDRSAAWLRLNSKTALALIVVAVLAPFLAKPFSLDEPLFLWAGQHLLDQPLNPYGFEVNWFGYTTPMWEATKNPPLCCYYLAGAASLLGWSEVALHAAFLLPALAAILGTFRLAQRFCRQPVFAAAATLLTPVFLVSGTTVMCDVLMLVFWVWAVVFWVEGTQNQRGLFLATAGCLVALAALTKYFGASLIVLLAAYSLTARARPARWIPPLLLPLAVLGAYHLATRNLYGHSLLADAVNYAVPPASLADFAALKSASCLSALAFLGGGLALATFFLPFLWRWRTICGFAVAAFLLAAILLLAGPLLKDYGPVQGSSRTLIGLQLLFWATGGAGILALAVVDLRGRRDAEAWLLALWVLGTFCFAAFINWTVNGRTVLPLAPAVGILLARRLEQTRPEPDRSGVLVRSLVFAAGAALALLVARADFLFAKSVRSSALTTYSKFGHEPHFRFQGHWGFQYYLRAAGAEALDVRHTLLQRGDIIATPENNTNFSPLGADLVVLREVILSSGPRWLATMKGEVGAGFYAASRGPLPFAFGWVPPDRVVVCAVDPLIPPVRSDSSGR